MLCDTKIEEALRILKHIRIQYNPADKERKIPSSQYSFPNVYSENRGQRECSGNGIT